MRATLSDFSSKFNCKFIIITLADESVVNYKGGAKALKVLESLQQTILTLICHAWRWQGGEPWKKKQKSFRPPHPLRRLNLITLKKIKRTWRGGEAGNDESNLLEVNERKCQGYARFLFSQKSSSPHKAKFSDEVKPRREKETKNSHSMFSNETFCSGNNLFINEWGEGVEAFSIKSSIPLANDSPSAALFLPFLYWGGAARTFSYFMLEANASVSIFIYFLVKCRFLCHLTLSSGGFSRMSARPEKKEQKERTFRPCTTANGARRNLLLLLHARWRGRKRWEFSFASNNISGAWVAGK